MDVFISHITEDSEVAIALKGWIESTFLGNYEVFVSSDSQSLPAGTKWLDEITKALTNSKILLILCSPESIYRPWINFEAGCGWARSITVIPICYGGLFKSQLPQPIATLQALELNQDFPEQLFIALKTHLSIKQLPRIDYTAMFSEISNAINSMKRNNAKNHRTIDSTINEKKEVDDIDPEKLTILKVLAQENRYFYLYEISDVMKMNRPRVEYHLEKMCTAGLVYAKYSPLYPTSYILDHNGREILFNKGLI
ncbi:MAG: TIR domain-containing protein [Chlorobaculum sp.]|nr:TIR domain-containing protein [Chlorobaculum sp.]